MSSSRVESDRQILADAQQRGGLATLGAWLKLSGPGWLQSAITLGGGSLASSLYLGILAGFALMWLQPLAMILGIIMLSAIGYVTLSTGKRPFRAINDHVNPVLGWGWALAVFAANIVWAMPQFSLANGVLTENLMPNFLGQSGAIMRIAGDTFTGDSKFDAFMAGNGSKIVVTIAILLISVAITWSYDRGGWGVRLYETMLKILVAIIVICFFGVVVVLSIKGNLDWAAIGKGLIPDFSQIVRPAASMVPILDQISSSEARAFWSNLIVDKQRDVIISAAATAVGINMTFLFPYSLLRKGWTKEFRGLTIFDLATGMFIPYVLATGCVVIASSAQFHTVVTSDFEINEAAGEVIPPERFEEEFNGYLEQRAKAFEEQPELQQPEMAEKKLAAMLVNRKASDLSRALEELTGKEVANYVFGIGVLAMTLSTITILMLISGFVVCEILGVPAGGWVHRIGTLLAGVGGTLGPFIWSGSSFYLAVPTSVFGFVLLPFAYITFMLLMNQDSLLGDQRPHGFRRLVWNTLMLVAATVATVGSIYMVWIKARYIGLAAVGIFTLLAIVVGVNRHNERRRDD